jgi:multidrug efflux pump subunit AcrA (membrane-fusion protein)
MVKKPVEKVEAEKIAEGQYGYSVKLSNVLHAAEQENLVGKQKPQGQSNSQTGSKRRFNLSEVKDRIKGFVSPSNLKEKLSPENLKNTSKTAFKAAHTHVNNAAQKSIAIIDQFSDFVTREEGVGRNEVVQKARSPILFGIWVCFITFVVGGLWSVIAPLDRAVHATGTVVASSKKQLIQHNEGGRLKSIDVREGQEVEAGQTLFTIENEELVAALKSARIQKEATAEQLKAMQELYKKDFVARTALIEAQVRDAEAESRVKAYEDRVERLNVTSPIAGVVNQIQVHTIGAPVPTAVIATVTPKNDELVIEAYVTPENIDLVHVGLEAKIQVTAFRHRSVGYFFGKVVFVSHDALDVPQTTNYSQEAIYASRGTHPYKVRISVDTEQLKHISKYRTYTMRPGMQADVTIVTGKRTLFQYIMDPLTATFMHAFTEN